MMKISYMRDPLASYLVIEVPEAAEDHSFEIRMLNADPLPDLLPFREETVDGKHLFLYDISGKQSFEKTFESGKLSCEILVSFLYSIKGLYDGMSEHLLDIDSVLIRQDCIFLGHSPDSFCFCCLPGSSSGFLKQLGELFNDLLGLIDYEDRQLVELAFELCRLSQTENFTLKEILAAAERSPFPGDEPGSSGAGPSGSKALYAGSSPGSISYSAASPPGSELLSPGSSPGNESLSAGSSPGRASFIDKAKIYFKGKSFSEIYDAVNSGKILRQIRNVYVRPEPRTLFVADSDPVFNSLEVNAASLGSKPEPGSPSHSDTASLNLSETTMHRLTGQDSAQGMIIYLDHFPFTIGKSSSRSDYQLDRPTISRIQCRIHEGADGTLEVEDMNSRNGTFVNNIVLSPYEYRTVHPGDTITLADMKFVIS